MKHYFSVFRKSIRFNQKFLYVLLLDLLFYVLLFIGTAAWSSALNVKATNIGDLYGLTDTEAKLVITKFLLEAAAYTILLLIFMLAAYSLIKGYIWSLILNKKLDSKYIKRFALLNLIWFVFLTLIIVIVALLTKSVEEISAPLLPILAFLSLLTKHPYFTTILLLLIAHTTALLQIFFRIEQSTRAVRRTFYTFKRFHLFLPYYAFILIPLVIVTAVSYIIRYLPETAYNTTTILLFIVFITWLRFYLVNVLKTGEI